MDKDFCLLVHFSIYSLKITYNWVTDFDKYQENATGSHFRCRKFLRCFFGVCRCWGTSWFTEYTSQISMSNISFHVSEESLEINIGGSGGQFFNGYIFQEAL